jgi:hypothetical protein
VSLCIEEAMGLAIGCQPGGTYYRCYFVSSVEAHFVGEAVVADTIEVEALAMRAHVPVGGGVLLLAAALLDCSFLLDLLMHDLGSFHHRLSPSQLFLYESHALILLAEAY